MASDIINDMNYFVAVISKEHLENYEICKRLGLWGMVRQFPAAKKVQSGDKILFYLSDIGFKAEAEALESIHGLTGDDWSPYDLRNFKWGFRIEFVTEFSRPHLYNFSRNINKEIGIKPGQLRFSFFSIEKWQYQKIVLGEGQIISSPLTFTMS